MRGSVRRCFWLGLFVGLEPLAAWGVEFESRFLRQGTAVDLERFKHDTSIPEGTVTLDVTVNQQWKGRHAVQLRSLAGRIEARPCYSAALLQAFGFDLARAPDDLRLAFAADEGVCVGIDDLHVPASESLDYNNLRLEVQIAQAAMRPQAASHLSSEQWDEGVTTAFINYHFSHLDERDQQGAASRYSFLGLRSGINSGRWYWRHEGIWQATGGSASRYQPGATWVTTDVERWSAQLTLGESYSRGQVFSSSAFKGVVLASDERMLPAFSRGFAPTVYGVANSTALLSIRQRGLLLHESTVEAGPFQIDDLPASGTGDLEVTLREAGGRVATFVQPYQAGSLALRPGAHRFELGGGQWRDGSGTTGPGFVQGSWQQGLANHLSLHGGIWLGERYLGMATGMALNSGFGAFSLTGYQSRSAVPLRGEQDGRAWRLGWHRRLGGTGTELGADLTQSDSAGYFTFDEFARATGGATRQPARTRLDLRLRQPLGQGNGRLQASFNSRSSWTSSGSSTGYALGYTNTFGSLGYGVDIRRDLQRRGMALNTLTISASLPLGERRRGLARTVTQTDSQGRSSSSLRWSDVGGDHGQWGYGLEAVRQSGGRENTGVGASLRRSGSAGQVKGGLTQRKDARLFNLEAQGAVVAHAGGLLAAPSLGDSFAILHAPGASAARVRQQPQVSLDARGYGVLPSLVPYEINHVELDPKGMSRDIELGLAAQSVVPRAGAAPLLHYPTRSGRAQMVIVQREDGAPLPFGALAVDRDGHESGMVGQGSRLHVRLERESERLKVIWGEADDEACWLTLDGKDRAVCTAGPEGG